MHQKIKVIACLACTLMLGTTTLRAQELDPPIPAVPDVLNEAAAVSAEAVPPPAQSILEAVTAYQSGWGSLRQDGSLHGQVMSPAGAQAGATVTIESGGASAGSATSDEQGRFVITGLSPGLYTLRADSGSSYAVHSVLLQQGGADSVMNVYCAGLPRSEVERMFSEMWSPGNWFDTPESSTVRLLGPPAPQTQNPRVNMRGGVVNGQLLFPSPNWLPSGHMVKVFRNGQLLATAPADQYGRFSFEPGTAGSVDIVAGGGAYGAMCVEIVDAGGSDISMTSSNGTRFVAKQDVPADVCLVPMVGEGVVTEEVVLADDACGTECCTPMGGYMGGGGGFGGGGGGGFGMGGWGGLLGAAGLAVGIAALADDDDGFDFNIPSPIAP